MLRVIFYNVGKGDMSLVLMPNGDAMMIDSFKAAAAAAGELTDRDGVYDRVERHIVEHRELLAATNPALKEAVANERAKKTKIRIAVLAITHADLDHITGSEDLKTRFDIGQLIDSGRDYVDPSDATKDYLALRKEMKAADKYIAFKRANFNIWPNSGAVVDVLAPNRDIAAEEDKNNQCMVIRIAYAGRSFLFTADSPLDDWVDPNTGILALHAPKVPSQILNVSHHGSRTFFTPPGPRPLDKPPYTKAEYDVRALQKISPMLSFITCSENEEADHPDEVALTLYQEHTNPGLSGLGKSHVILSRHSQHLHHVVESDGRLYLRTSRSRMSRVKTSTPSSGPYLEGTVNSDNGYLTPSGIWVSRTPLSARPDIEFSVTAKGKWSGPINFDWWVLNNGQEEDALHREFYTMDSKDRKKESKWSRPLSFKGVHLMQCHASTEDGKDWANWCVLVCQEVSLPHAVRWLELFPKSIDPSRINRE